MKYLKYYVLGVVIILLCTSISLPNKADGYDISHHNKNIKWDKLKVKFVYLKATQGIKFVDPKYNEYKTKAKQSQMLVGAYHFMNPKQSGKSQFQHFKSVVGKDIDLIPVLDVEVPEISDRDLLEFITECEKYYGVKPMIYARIDYYYKYYATFAGCKLWLSQKIPISPFIDYHIWQYKIDNVYGVNLDHNYINPKYTINHFLLH